MIERLTPVAAGAALLVTFLAGAAEMETGSVPATEHQMEALQKTPEAATERPATARGMTVGDMPVSPHQGQVIEDAGARFGFFDVDKDGHISASESQAEPALESQWKDLDRNADDRLDRSEFARFEPQSP
jgi:hypothetical protein